jgi:phage/plasmid-associated DNA primase
VFIEERCVVARNAKATVAELYRAYGFWCGAHGERAVSLRAFGDALEERGFDRGREGHASTRLWLGIGVLADRADAADASSGISELDLPVGGRSRN